MKAKRNVTDLAGEKVMVDFEQGKYFCIKGVGNDIWDMLDGQDWSAVIVWAVGDFCLAGHGADHQGDH